MMKKFVDQITLNLQAGNGGNGLASFFQDYRQRYAQPDGGDGGNGASIIFEASNSLNSLDHFQSNQTIAATHGTPGKPKRKDGANGENAVFRVPVGTLIFNSEKTQLLADLAEPGQTYLAARGGKGGLGNTHFAHSPHHPTTHSEPGTIGVHKKLILELKLIASIGLIGLPNAGKSSLLKRLTAANPDVANYEFTTLIPNLGVLKRPNQQSLTIADLPGLIRGAAQNKGLGNRFLRHAERCSVLLHLVDFSIDNVDKIRANINAISQELIAYNSSFRKIPQIIVANKSDLPAAQQNFADFQKLAASPVLPFAISATEGTGVAPLVDWIFNYFARHADLPTVISYNLKKSSVGVPVFTPNFEAEIRLRKLTTNTWELSGKFVQEIEKKYKRDPQKALNQVNSLLDDGRVARRLAKEGVQKGDVFFVFGSQFTWVPSTPPVKKGQKPNIE